MCKIPNVSVDYAAARCGNLGESTISAGMGGGPGPGVPLSQAASERATAGLVGTRWWEDWSARP